jgi:hypothetical protein
MKILPFAALLPALAATFALAAPDIVTGRKLIEESRCELCHNNKTMGDAKAIYLRKDRKVNSFAKLKAQVSVCSSQLNLGLFPEDEEHIVAYLDATYYHFGGK